MKAYLLIVFVALGLVGPLARQDPPQGCQGRVVVQTERFRLCLFTGGDA